MKTIIFDFGGVLIDWEPRNIFRHFFPNQPQALEDFLTETQFAEWNSQQDKGRSFAEGVDVFSKEFPQYAHIIRAFHENWKESISGAIEGSAEILKTLKQQGYPLYGLSNWSAETFPIARGMFPFFEAFDGIILSGEVKLIKPDPAIFEHCLKVIGKPAPECFFIDDSPANIRVAEKMGFEVIHFTSPQQLKKDLNARGFSKL